VLTHTSPVVSAPLFPPGILTSTASSTGHPTPPAREQVIFNLYQRDGALPGPLEAHHPTACACPQTPKRQHTTHDVKNYTAPVRRSIDNGMHCYSKVLCCTAARRYGTQRWDTPTPHPKNLCNMHNSEGHHLNMETHPYRQGTHRGCYFPVPTLGCVAWRRIIHMAV
jgi:hypothetical protein